MASGKTNHEIAVELHIGLGTTKTHISSIMTKLDARNRLELVIWAYETDRVSPNRNRCLVAAQYGLAERR